MSVPDFLAAGHSAVPSNHPLKRFFEEFVAKLAGEDYNDVVLLGTNRLWVWFLAGAAARDCQLYDEQCERDFENERRFGL